MVNKYTEEKLNCKYFYVTGGISEWLAGGKVWLK
jgi:hypothetical protein